MSNQSDTFSTTRITHCITCSDEALPARVLSISEADGMALVAVGNETSEVDISLVDDVSPGDILLIHGGVALEHSDQI